MPLFFRTCNARPPRSRPPPPRTPFRLFRPASSVTRTTLYMEGAMRDFLRMLLLRAARPHLPRHFDHAVFVFAAATRCLRAHDV